MAQAADRQEIHCKFRLSQTHFTSNLRNTFCGIFQVDGEVLFCTVGREVFEVLSSFIWVCKAPTGLPAHRPARVPAGGTWGHVAEFWVLAEQIHLLLGRANDVLPANLPALLFVGCSFKRDMSFTVQVTVRETELLWPFSSPNVWGVGSTRLELSVRFLESMGSCSNHFGVLYTKQHHTVLVWIC